MTEIAQYKGAENKPPRGLADGHGSRIISTSLLGYFLALFRAPEWREDLVIFYRVFEIEKGDFATRLTALIVVRAWSLSVYRTPEVNTWLRTEDHYEIIT